MRVVSHLFLIVILFLSIPTITYADDCLTAGFWVEDGFYNFFKTQGINFEDWADKQMREWNKVFSSSGVNECVQIGKIVRKSDSSLPLSGGLPTNTPDVKDRTVDLQWGFPTDLIKSKEGRDGWARVAKDIDWGLLHELSHARYLIDEYGLNVGMDNNRIDVTTPQGVPIVGTYLKPIAWDIVYANKSQDLMGAGDRYYAPHSAGALNLASHRHWAKEYGNYNAPSNLGTYLNDLPANNIFHILDANSKSLSGAGIRIFPSSPNPGSQIYGKWFRNTPAIVGETNEAGNISVGHNPFGGDRISPFMTNSLVILEVSYKDQLFYKFIEVTDFNLAYWAGAQSEATYDIKTNIVGDDPSHTGTFSIKPSIISVGANIIITGQDFGNDPGRIIFTSTQDSSKELSPDKFTIEKWQDDLININIKKDAIDPDSQSSWNVRLATQTNKNFYSKDILQILGFNIGRKMTTGTIDRLSSNVISIGRELSIYGYGFGEQLTGASKVKVYRKDKPEQELTQISYLSWTDNEIRLLIQDSSLSSMPNSVWKIAVTTSDGQLIEYVGDLLVEKIEPILLPYRFFVSCGQEFRPLANVKVSIIKNLRRDQPLVSSTSREDGYGALTLSIYPDKGSDGEYYLSSDSINGVADLKPIPVLRIQNGTTVEATYDLAPFEYPDCKYFTSNTETGSNNIKRITKIIFNNEEIDLKNPEVNLKVTSDQSSPMIVPVSITYSDGSSRSFAFSFDLPSNQESPSPTALSTLEPTPYATNASTPEPTIEATPSPYQDNNLLTTPSPIPTELPRKKVADIRVNSQSIDLSAASFELHLSAAEFQGGSYVVPIQVIYSDGSSRSFAFSLIRLIEPTPVETFLATQAPQPTESPTEIPSPTPASECRWEQLPGVSASECNWETHQVYDVYQNTCTGDYDRRNYQYKEGECGYTGQQTGSACPQWTRARDVCIACGKSRLLEKDSCSNVNRLNEDIQLNDSCNDAELCQRNAIGCKAAYPECHGLNTFYIIPICDETKEIVDYIQEDLGNLGQCQ